MKKLLLTLALILSSSTFASEESNKVHHLFFIQNYCQFPSSATLYGELGGNPYSTKINGYSSNRGGVGFGYAPLLIKQIELNISNKICLVDVNVYIEKSLIEVRPPASCRLENCQQWHNWLKINPRP